MIDKEKIAEVKKIHQEMEEEFDKLERFILKSYLKDIKDALYRINYEIVNDWYTDYKQIRYKRKFDLFNYLKVTVDYKKFTINVTWDPANGKKWHRVDSVNGNYIFYNSFIMGYHGGADDFLRNPPLKGYEEPHPMPGTPYWRSPPFPLIDGTLIWQHWFDLETPAYRSYSPYNAIVFEAEQRKADLVDYYETIYGEKSAEIKKRTADKLLQLLKK